MKLYLDVDGVLLATKGGNTFLVGGAEPFLYFILTKFKCYWLTSHCKGDTKPVLRYLSHYVDACLYKKLEAIRATNYVKLKTEVLEGQSDFLWIDDNPSVAEIKWLKENDKLGNWIKVDSNKDEDALFKCLLLLQRKYT